MKIPGIRFWCRGFFSVLLSDALAKAFQKKTYIRHIGLVLFHRFSCIRVEQSHDCGKQDIIQRIYCFFKICYLQILFPLFIIEFRCHWSVLLEFYFVLLVFQFQTSCLLLLVVFQLFYKVFRDKVASEQLDDTCRIVSFSFCHRTAACAVS